MKLIAAALTGLALVATAAQAEVTDRSAAGFEVVQKATIAAPRGKVWAALMTPGAWWSSQHSWSGSARNLKMDLGQGCFCETLPKGYVRHMTIVYVDGGSTLRMSGALGPFQMTGASGHIGVVLKDAGAGRTDLTLTYDVGGYAKGGLAETLAAPADGVLGEAVARLKRYAETGNPD